jgi:hypothetical protein
MLTATCDSCSRELRIDDQYAGRSGTCNHCGGKIIVPQAGEHQPPSQVVNSQESSKGHEANSLTSWAGRSLQDQLLSVKTGTAVIPNLVAFLIGLYTAWNQQQQAGDLVWSLWLSSLVLGAVSFVIIALSRAYFFLHWFSQETRTGKELLGFVLFALFGGAFFLGFLSLVFFFFFCGFHSLHALFLTHFFPLEGVIQSTFFDTLKNPTKLLDVSIAYIFPYYSGFLLLALIRERSAVFGPLTRIVRETHFAHLAGDDDVLSENDETTLQRELMKPMLNIWRLHLLIAVFIVFDEMQLQSFPLVAIVYTVYFFPWTILWNREE